MMRFRLECLAIGVAGATIPWGTPNRPRGLLFLPCFWGFARGQAWVGLINTAEVVHAQVRVVDDERVEEAVEDVGAEVVVVGDIEGFVGEALSSEVDGDDAMGFGELGEDVAVEVVCLRRDSQLRALLEPLERVVVVEIEALEASIFGRWLGRAPRLRWRGLRTFAKLGLFGGVGWTFL